MNDENVWDVEEKSANVRTPDDAFFNSQSENPGEISWPDPDTNDLSGWDINEITQASAAIPPANGREELYSGSPHILTPDFVLPHGLERQQIFQTSEDWLSGLLADQSNGTQQGDYEDLDDIAPLSIDSTREVWGRLTSVKPKIFRFEGSNIEREVLTILRLWRAKTKSQPSWTSTRNSLLNKKNRVSFGADLFGWDKAPVADTAKTTTDRTNTYLSTRPKAAALGSPLAGSSRPERSRSPLVENSRPESSESPLVDDQEDDFGDFESAEVLPSKTKNIPVESVVSNIGQSPQADQHPSQANRHEDKSVVSEPAPAAAPTAWDFSLFEQTFSAPIPEPQSKNTTIEHRHGAKQEDKTVGSVVALLPSLDYLLS